MLLHIKILNKTNLCLHKTEEQRSNNFKNSTYIAITFASVAKTKVTSFYLLITYVVDLLYFLALPTFALAKRGVNGKTDASVAVVATIV
jgi:hypothetical protein